MTTYNLELDHEELGVLRAIVMVYGKTQRKPMGMIAAGQALEILERAKEATSTVVPMRVVARVDLPVDQGA